MPSYCRCWEHGCPAVLCLARRASRLRAILLVTRRIDYCGSQGEKESGDHGTTPSDKCSNEGIVPGFQTTGISRRLEVHDQDRSDVVLALSMTDEIDHFSACLIGHT